MRVKGMELTVLLHLLPSTHYYLLLLLSATGEGLEASTTPEKEISSTKVVQTVKNIKPVSNFALLHYLHFCMGIIYFDLISAFLSFLQDPGN